jgi:hypothetical protein
VFFVRYSAKTLPSVVLALGKKGYRDGEEMLTAYLSSAAMDKHLAKAS